MTQEECRKYAVSILVASLSKDQYAALAFLVDDDYPVGQQGKRGFLERLSKLKIRRSQK